MINDGGAVIYEKPREEHRPQRCPCCVEGGEPHAGRQVQDVSLSCVAVKFAALPD